MSFVRALGDPLGLPKLILERVSGEFCELGDSLGLPKLILERVSGEPWGTPLVSVSINFLFASA